jgi:hypothetical protein
MVSRTQLRTTVPASRFDDVSETPTVPAASVGSGEYPLRQHEKVLKSLILGISVAFLTCYAISIQDQRAHANPLRHIGEGDEVIQLAMRSNVSRRQWQAAGCW